MSENMRTFVTDGLTEGAGFTRASPNKISIGDVSVFTKSFVPRSVNFPSPTIMFLLLTKMDEGDMSYNILLKDFPRWGGGHRVSTISYTNSPLPRPTACEACEHLALSPFWEWFSRFCPRIIWGSYFTEFPLNSTTTENIRLCRCIRHGFALVDPHHPHYASSLEILSDFKFLGENKI